MRDEVRDIGNRGVVSGFERGIDGRKRKRGRVQAAAGAGDRSHGEEVRGYVGVLVGGGISGAVVEYRAIVRADLNRMLSFYPTYVVHDVVCGNIDDAGRIRSASGTGTERVHAAEGSVVLMRTSPIGITLPDKPVPQIIDDGVRDRPNVASGNSLGIIESRGVWQGARKLFGVYCPVILKIAAHK